MNSKPGTMVSNPDHKQNMVDIVREEIFNDASVDVLIVCRNGEKTKSNKVVLHWFSPLLRSVFSDAIGADTIYLPEFEKDTLDKVLSLLNISENSQRDIWSNTDMDLLTTFSVSTKDFYPKHFPDIKTEPEDSGIDKNIDVELDKNNREDVDVTMEEWSIGTIKNILSQQCDYGLDFKTVINGFIKQEEPENEDEIEDEETHNIENMDSISSTQTLPKIELKLEPAQFFPPKNELNTKCPMCDREFSGTFGRLKDKLKCHIGMLHYHNEMLSQYDEFYGNSNTCLKCGKNFDNLSNSYKENARKKHLVFNHSKYAREILKIVVEHLGVASDMNFKLRDTAAQDIEEEDVKKEKEKSNFSYFCLECEHGWISSQNSKKLIRKHVLYHLKDDFQHHVAQNFISNTCLVCGKSIQTNQDKRLHLYEKHGVLTGKINFQVEGILKNKKLSEKKFTKFNAQTHQRNENKGSVLEQASVDLLEDELELSDDDLFTQSDDNITKLIEETYG